MHRSDCPVLFFSPQLCGLSPGAPALGATHVGSLAGHSGAVNCIRSSPDGRSLASAGDGGELLLWDRVHADLGCVPPPAANKSAFADAGEQPYRRAAVLRGHGDDVMAVAWSSDGRALASGSVDARVVTWEAPSLASPALAPAAAGSLPAVVRPPPASAPSPASSLALSRPSFLSGHRSLIQGLAWDPRGRYLVSQSADRTCRVWGRRGKGGAVCLATLARGALGAGALQGAVEDAKGSAKEVAGGVAGAPGERERSPEPPGEVKAAKAISVASHSSSPAPPSAPATPPPAPPSRATPLFADESLLSFFRRPAWSPDGHLLALPAGIVVARGAGGVAGPLAASTVSAATPPSAAVSNAVHVYAAGHWDAPTLTLRGLPRPALAVAWCPIRFQPPSPERAPLGLPYALVLACATSDGVVLLSTAHDGPLLALGALHLDTITDVAWAPDGRTLAVSSLDGFCSVVRFDPGELGEPYVDEEGTTEANAKEHEKADEEARRGGAGKAGNEPTRVAAPAVDVPPTAASKQASAAITPKLVHAAATSVTTPSLTKSAAASVTTPTLTKPAATPAATSTPTLPSPNPVATGMASQPQSKPVGRSARKRITPEPLASSGATAPSAAFAPLATSPPSSSPSGALSASPTLVPPSPVASALLASPSAGPATPPKRRRVVPTPVGPGETICSMRGFDRPSRGASTPSSAASFATSLSNVRKNVGDEDDATAGSPAPGSPSPRETPLASDVPSSAPSFSFDTAGLRSEAASPVLGPHKESEGGKEAQANAASKSSESPSSPVQAPPALESIAAFAMAAGKQAAKQAKR